MNYGSAGIVYTDPVTVLILGENLIHANSDQLAGFVPEPETEWYDFAICVGTGNHLYGDVNAQHTFHSNMLLS